ncbi:uncharacterized protein LOC110040732 isoform X3 [Orbicella faveolata]|nr:uncharacterized protein LOC110040732 isoform X3 [Orbicella faveolata]
MNKNFRRKTRAIILETDSQEEENDSPSIGANCDSSERKQIQSTEMKDEQAVARKRSHDRRSDEEKTSLPGSKDVTLEKESRKDQHADTSGKREVKTEEDEEVVISCSKKGENNARIYDKRHSCFYCDKMCAKIARHYEHHHKDEAEVAETFAYPRGSKDHKKALEKLRLRGNFHHNLRVLERKKEQLIVMRRPGEEEDCCQDDYLPYIHCLGFVKRKDLWRHNKACNFKSGDEDDKNDKDDNDYMKCQKLQTKSKLLILPSLCPGKGSPYQEFLASMKSDQITLVARNDSVISALGTMMVEKVGTSRCHDISQNMRNLARLLMSLREAENTANAQLLQFLRPDKFDVVVQCVMDISKFDVKMGESRVGTPSLALHFGYSLKKCVGIVRGKALREKDRGLLEDVEHFEKLIEAEWNYRISHHSMTTLNDRRHNQPNLLPVTSDLRTLKEYITLKIVSLSSQLQYASIPDVRTWRELSKMVLNRLILFNKRRGGEAARLEVETYTNRPDWQKSISQDVASLSDIEQQLFRRYCIKNTRLNKSMITNIKE